MCLDKNSSKGWEARTGMEASLFSNAARSGRLKLKITFIDSSKQ